MRILCWNIQKKPLERLVARLAAAENADIVILIEPDNIKTGKQTTMLSNECGDTFGFHPLPANKRFYFFSRYPPYCFRPRSDSHDWGIMSLRLPITRSITLVAIHSYSKLYWSSPGDRFALALRIRQEVEKIEAEDGHDRTVLVGDFNSNPFDDAMTNADGLHAVMCSTIASQGERKVGGQSRKYFYNPMWSLLGDTSPGPAGSYFYRTATASCLFWNTFDQVLIRPSLMKSLVPKSVRIVDTIKDQSLSNKQGIPDKLAASDHFPIVFEIDTQSGELCNV